MNKLQKKISGVYKITNKITGDFYIGSSNDVKGRWAGHKRASKWKRYPNIKLYQDMTKYGKDSFIFDLIEETDNLKEREQYWISQLKPTYNIRWAKGWDIKSKKEYNKEWTRLNHTNKLAKDKVYLSRLCLYNGETLTLNALSKRFCRQGIAHPYKEAKEYLL